MKNPKELRACYPYQFQGPQISMSFSRGWFCLFAGLCADIDHVLGEDKKGFHWTQVKEKFGATRLYFQLAPGMNDRYPDLIQQLLELKVKAEVASQHVCAACGRPGEIALDSVWMLALCDAHRKEMAEGKEVSLWFSEDDV
jgi:hypothetical protein